MFWKREEKILSSDGISTVTAPPVPPKKEYVDMLELLREAEHFSNGDDSAIETAMLGALMEAIERYKTNAR